MKGVSNDADIITHSHKSFELNLGLNNAFCWARCLLPTTGINGAIRRMGTDSTSSRMIPLQNNNFKVFGFFPKVVNDALLQRSSRRPLLQNCSFVPKSFYLFSFYHTAYSTTRFLNRLTCPRGPCFV